MKHSICNKYYHKYSVNKENPKGSRERSSILPAGTIKDIVRYNDTFGKLDSILHSAHDKNGKYNGSGSVCSSSYESVLHPIENDARIHDLQQDFDSRILKQSISSTIGRQWVFNKSSYNDITFSRAQLHTTINTCDDHPTVRKIQPTVKKIQPSPLPLYDVDVEKENVVHSDATVSKNSRLVKNIVIDTIDCSPFDRRTIIHHSTSYRFIEHHHVDVSSQKIVYSDDDREIDTIHQDKIEKDVVRHHNNVKKDKHPIVNQEKRSQDDDSIKRGDVQYELINQQNDGHSKNQDKILFNGSINKGNDEKNNSSDGDNVLVDEYDSRDEDIDRNLIYSRHNGIRFQSFFRFKNEDIWNVRSNNNNRRNDEWNILCNLCNN